MKDYIQAKWFSKELPGISNLLYANGSVILFDSYSVKENDVRKIYCFPLCDTTILSLEKYNDDIWTEIEIYQSVSIPYNNGSIISGGGSMGNEGFVCHINEEKNIVWSYFFDFSNPIVKLSIKENTLQCISNNNISVLINLNNLSLVDVIYPQY